MKRTLLLLTYYTLYPLALLLSLPLFFWKMKKRKGFGTGVRERFGLYRSARSLEPQRGLYIHAVSVGETMIALKFIRAWQSEHDEPVILAVSTATGHLVARNARTEKPLRVIYSPFDLPGIVGRCLTRFRPRAVALIEAELWPHFAECCDRLDIPIIMLNARLSPRSERRYRRIRGITRMLFEPLSALATQNERDRGRFIGIGVDPSIINTTGSIKFDINTDADIPAREDFIDILATMSGDKPIVLASSTHAGEEKLLAHAIAEVGAFPLIIPRHEERRHDVMRDLESLGLRPLLRSSHLPHGLPEDIEDYDCYIADTTGEMRDWTQLADLVIIGKSFLSKGGQNPVEAIAAKIPVIAGPHMENFADLVALLEEADGITITPIEALQTQIKLLLHHPSLGATQVEQALRTLEYHAGATERSVELVSSFFKRS